MPCSQKRPLNVVYGHVHVHVFRSIRPPFEQNAPPQSHSPLSQLDAEHLEHLSPLRYGSNRAEYVCLLFVHEFVDVFKYIYTLFAIRLVIITQHTHISP